MKIDKNDIQRYRELERLMFNLFKVFAPLCRDCYDFSLRMLNTKAKVVTEDLCCCMCDNQVHDYWPFLDPVQRKVKGPNWSKILPINTIEIKRRRVPNNGPCKALTAKGCVISSFRPPTCTTQLCPMMVHIIFDAGLVAQDSCTPVQLEEILGYGNLYDRLYGLKKGAVSDTEFLNALSRITSFSRRLSALDPDYLNLLIRRQMRTR